MAAARRLGPWLVGLFLAAQVFGIVPLMSEHTAHVAETQLTLSRDSSGAESVPQGHHHRGDADGFFQHHELQDLSGAFACFAVPCQITFVHVAITALAPKAPAQAIPILLERPPKPPRVGGIIERGSVDQRPIQKIAARVVRIFVGVEDVDNTELYRL